MTEMEARIWTGKEILSWGYVGYFDVWRWTPPA
jgi:hypothetical protein